MQIPPTPRTPVTHDAEDAMYNGAAMAVSRLAGGDQLPANNTADRPGKFRYRPPVVRLLAGILFMGGGGWISAQAATDGRGLIIDGFITLSPAGASIFWWAISAISFAFAGWIICYCIPQLFFNRYIMLEATAITLPRRAFWTGDDRIEAAAIRNFSVRHYRGYWFVDVEHTRGKFRINSAYLSSESEIQAISAWLGRNRRSNFA